MTSFKPVEAPTREGVETLVYVANPRAKRSFNTVLDAHDLFDRGGRSQVTTRVHGAADARRVEITAEHALKGGSIRETLTLSAQDGLRSLHLARRAQDADGAVSRAETIDFTRGPIRLPDTTYPEVLLPFVLRWQPLDRARQAVYAWSVDRFVARVYCEWAGRHTLTVPAGRFETVELVMYPDLDDWVSLGIVVNRLVKPFLPKYRMWFETAEARRVVRFEGSYGPPGAPEIVLELA